MKKIIAWLIVLLLVPAFLWAGPQITTQPSFANNVGQGGTGATSLTDGGILVGNGTSAITVLSVATNGWLPIGSTGADPVLAAITGTAGQVTVTNGAGSITLASPALLGDGTAGRKLKAHTIRIQNGTNAATIKVDGLVTGLEFNGDILAQENNLAKSGDTGNFALNADGSILNIQVSGLTGNVVGVLNSPIGYNYSATAVTANIGSDGANGYNLTFQNAATGAAVDLTTLVDTGSIYVQPIYVTAQ